MYSKILKVPLYPTRVCVIISNSDKKINKFFKSQGMEEYRHLETYTAFVDEGVVNHNKEKGLRCIYIVFRHFGGEFTHGVINHEIRHATNKVLDIIGHRLDPLNDEPEAYLSQWLADIVYGSMKESGRIDKIKLVTLHK